MAPIEFHGLRKIFPNGAVAVDDFDLAVADGEFMILVGPSGSGKTTVLRIAAGLEEASGGDVLIDGRVVNDVSPMDRDIAMVFQNYALYPHMSVYDNMAFALKRHRVQKHEIRARVDAAAKMLGIDDLLKRKPSQLSGGQRQRVAMGRAVVREPVAFLMDEPLSNLDAKLRVEMRAYLATLHQRLRTTTLYVTHDQTEAMTMGDRVAVMRDGRLQQVDRPQVLYDTPTNLFVAGFIGSPAMNLVHSRMTAANGAVHVELGATQLRLPDAVFDGRPRLRDYVGGPVVLGIRPEDLEEASDTNGGGDATLDVRCSLAEPMGAELIAHFPVTARPVARSLSLALARGEQTEATGAAEPGDEALFTARLSPRCRAQTGGRLRIAVDCERLHFFDPETEEAIR